jgi:hypothetical protein
MRVSVWSGKLGAMGLVGLTLDEQIKLMNSYDLNPRSRKGKPDPDFLRAVKAESSSWKISTLGLHLLPSLTCIARFDTIRPSRALGSYARDVTTRLRKSSFA